MLKVGIINNREILISKINKKISTRILSYQ